MGIHLNVWGCRGRLRFYIVVVEQLRFKASGLRFRASSIWKSRWCVRVSGRVNTGIILGVYVGMILVSNRFTTALPSRCH